jgi:CubicO group peptidase (beta-lactamase class C family)
MSEIRDWAVVSPKSMRMSHEKLDALRDILAEHHTQSLLVVRRDRIIYEWYTPGRGMEKPHYTASLAKALVGGLSLMLALNDGLLDADDLVCNFIPPWRHHPQKSRITIRHLATHSSGLSDSVTRGVDHAAQPGWAGNFWRGRSNPAFNPIQIAIDQTPIIFEPGTDYAYSNPGMAVLSYVVTAALKDTPAPDTRTLLRNRLMQPLGIPDKHWTISYGRTYETDGLPVCANWGGGNYTARSVARVGQLMLHHGLWEGQQLVSPESAKQVLRYAGMPLPDRTPCNPQPGSGLCWYTNFDGVWANLPRDAFAGAGAGHQVLLVIPCRDLIVVRNGESLSEDSDCFWGDLYQYLFSPLMDTFLPQLPEDANLAPYPPSPVIRKIDFAPVSSIKRKGFHGDNWPITWAADDAQYTAYGDGYGFKPYLDKVLSLGFVKITGTPDDFKGSNIRSESGERAGYGVAGAKASGLLMVDGLLYLLARNTGNAQLAWSADDGHTWEWSFWKFTTSFGHPTFLNYGKNYNGARDDYVYIYSPDADSAYIAADRMVLARVPRNRIKDRSAYNFFVKVNEDRKPIWTSDISKRGAVFSHAGYCRRSQISYHAGLGRYLWWQQFSEMGVDTRFQGGFGIYDAPEPWGPWTTVYFTHEWDTGPGEMGVFPVKWMHEDGKTCHLVFSGNDCFSVRKAVFST